MNATFHVIHPLDAPPERKRNVDLGPMKLTPAVRISLFALRVYLILMALLLLYRVLRLARIVR